MTSQDMLNDAEIERTQNLRQLLFALVVSANHALICFFYFANDNFRLELGDLLTILGIIWLGNLTFLAAFLSGFSERFKDPIMTLPLMLWIGLGIIISSYYLENYRLSMMILSFGLMLLGAFRIGFKLFFMIVVAALIGYSMVLYFAMTNHPAQTDTTIEVIELLMFILVTIGMLVTVTRIAALQAGLGQQSKELGEALERVHELAIRDELTGMYNRRRVMELLREQINLSEAGDYDFVVCYLDLDHFKQVNDTYGHGVGDEVIKRFADVSNKAVRAVDYSGRLGGEEFIVVLTNTQLNSCLVVAERIREQMEAEVFVDMPDRNVTVSIGVSQYRKGESLEDLLNRADANLYASKDTGRNKITHDS